MYVGIQLELRHDGIFLHQKQYARNVVENFLGSFSRRAKTPIQKGADLTPRTSEEEALDSEKYPYRRVVGKILYIANMSRPDIANAASELGKSCGEPTMRHWRALQHVLRYLHSTTEYGILYPRTVSNPKLVGYCDADFAGDTSSRKSCTGYIMKLGDTIIEWKSRTQRTIATSTTEAEWTALSEGTRHAEFIRGLLSELGFHQQCITWWCDNAPTIVTASTPGHNGRTRHLDVKLKKTRELVKNEKIKIKYIPTSEQLADGLTKRLDANLHKHFLECTLVKGDSHAHTVSP